jgi:hypothetical protein
MMESSATAVQRILESVPDGGADDPAVRLQDFLQKLITSFTADSALWSANIECLAQALHSPEIRTELGNAQANARTELTHLFPPADKNSHIGAVLQTLIGGLLLQWLVDPDHAPTATDITTGLHNLAART